MAVRFQVSEMEEMTIWEQYTITLNRAPRFGFGIAISGGRDRPTSRDGDNSVIVSDVVRGGPADGRLQTRDRIVMVNGVSMENVASAYAIQTLKSCPKQANVTVKRPRKVQVPVSTKPNPLNIQPASTNSYRSANTGRYDSDEGGNGHSEEPASPALSSDRGDRHDSYSRDKYPDNVDHNRGYDGDSSSERSSGNYRSGNRPKQSNSEKRRSHDGSSGRRSQDSYRRWSRDSGSERRSNSGRYPSNGFSYDPDDRSHGLALVSGFKRLPSQDVPLKPMKSVLVKRKDNEEYGLKLGSQIFIKHITETGLAAQESGLQEGDLILKINGVVSENMSLADTRRLIERSDGKLTLTVLRDNRQFLVNIPEVEDSETESRSSRLDDISDLGSEPTPPPSLPPPPPPGNLSDAETNSPPEVRRYNGNSPDLPPVEVSPAPAAHDHRVLAEPVTYSEQYGSSNAMGTEEHSSGYSPDARLVQFTKEGSIGLRLAGGNDVGIFVASVQPNSPAAREGLKEGDQILQVNETSFQNVTREEAVQYLMQLPQYQEIMFLTQGKQDIYKKMVKSNVGDSFHIRTHFDHEADAPSGLSFTRGEVFHVVDTMYHGKVGSWLAIRLGQDLQALDKGIIPNGIRAEQMASLESVQKPSLSSSSGPRAEFWKLRGLRGAKKNLRKSREDLAALTTKANYPPYEKVVLREASFKRPIVILGPITDIAMQKLDAEMPEEFEIAQSVSREEGTSKIIKLQLVRAIAEKDKHALLDITPTAVEHLNYVKFYPIVVFCNPENRQGVKAMRQWLMPDSKKSSRRLYTQAVKMRKNCSHVFTATINLSGASDSWYRSLKEIIKNQQSRPIWTAEDQVEIAQEDDDLLNQPTPSGTDYLSCDSRANSDYEDTDGEGGAYTDNEMDEVYGQPALSRSSEPVEVEPEDTYMVPRVAAGVAYSSAPYSSAPYSSEDYSPATYPATAYLPPAQEEEEKNIRPQGQWKQHLSREYEHDALKKKFTRARSYSSGEEEEEEYSWGGPATDL
ncbi:tight junction protein ZO-3 isoform X2 [Ambystoma mexicanum]|uniref:tight junction protein ZO-3 isoform X2 n=2 Tax=Ambystoma mexicanum TaxID=8296 RepID=UPI0037E841CA